MAYIRKRKDSYKVEIRKKGHPHIENMEEFIQRQIYNYSDTKMPKPQHMAKGGSMVSYDKPKDDWEVIYNSMSPIEKGQFNARNKKTIKITGSAPSYERKRIAGEKKLMNLEIVLKSSFI